MPTSAAQTYTIRKLEPAHPSPEPTVGSVPMGQGTYQRGQVLGEVTATRRYGDYDDAGAGGLDTARAIAMYDMVVDSSGNVALGGGSTDEWGATLKSAPVYLTGAFRCEDLVGLTAAAVADLGRLVEGDTASGLLHVM